jgi:hypothetical protein
MTAKARRTLEAKTARRVKRSAAKTTLTTKPSRTATTETRKVSKSITCQMKVRKANTRSLPEETSRVSTRFVLIL